MNCELLREKFLLLDTNVLIYFLKYPPFMAALIKRLEEAGVNLVLDDLVKFEFLRGANSPNEEATLKDFLQKLFRISMEEVEKSQFVITAETIKLATEIANIYSSRLKNTRIELVDCFIAGQMKKYNATKANLYLATVNHKDFPKLLFDRVGIETIDTDEDIINIGFYMFNRERFANERILYFGT